VGGKAGFEKNAHGPGISGIEGGGLLADRLPVGAFLQRAAALPKGGKSGDLILLEPAVDLRPGNGLQGFDLDGRKGLRERRRRGARQPERRTNEKRRRVAAVRSKIVVFDSVIKVLGLHRHLSGGESADGNHDTRFCSAGQIPAPPKRLKTAAAPWYAIALGTGRAGGEAVAKKETRP
jgi:hypothetical protein